MPPPAMAAITTSMAKYSAMKVESDAEKPWSIMRRTASGRASVVAAATTSEMTAPMTSLR